METFSELKIYSIGIVAKNKEILSRVIEVVPVEDSPMLDGDINSEIITEKVSSENSDQAKSEIKTTTALSIKAIWLPMGSSNRFSAPDVRRGEQVVIYRFSDEDVFYWTTLHDDIKLRKLETVIYAFSGTKDEKVKTVDPEHYYFLEVSTHKGLVHFSSSKKNGEYCSYDFQINTKDGFYQFKDDLGNVFMFDSKEKQISMVNTDGTYFEINKKNLTINVPETYTIIAKNIVEKVSENVQTTVEGSITEKAKTVSVEASGVLNTKSGGKTTIKGAGVDISGPVKLS